MVISERIDGMTLTDFMERWEREGPFELIDGEIKPLMPNTAAHIELVTYLLTLLRQFCLQTRRGVVFVEATFVQLYSTDWVRGSRVPDIAFFALERWQVYRAAEVERERKPFTLVPDLVVEVVSPTDKFADIEAKAERYLHDGVRAVWLMNPQSESIHVYAADAVTVYRRDDVFDGGAVLPGFTMAVRELFHDPMLTMGDDSPAAQPPAP